MRLTAKRWFCSSEGRAAVMSFMAISVSLPSGYELGVSVSGRVTGVAKTLADPLTLALTLTPTLTLTLPLTLTLTLTFVTGSTRQPATTNCPLGTEFFVVRVARNF